MSFAMGHPTNFTAVSESERQIKLALYVFTFVLGVTGNSLVLFFLWKKKRKSVNDLLICNLSTSDLALMLLSLPINVFLLSGTSFPTLFCKIISPLMTVTFNVSIFTLTFMAVYRWRVIINSLQPEMRHRHIFAWIVGIWLMGFLLLLPLIIVAEKDQTGGCREDWKLQQSRAYTAVLFMLQYVLPLVTIAGAYVLIANDLGKSKQRQICNAQDRFALEVRRKEDLQIIKMMGLIVILFAVCILPIQIAWLISDFGSNEHKGVGNVLLRVADIAAYLHACVNPIVYGTITKYFRRQYIRYIKSIFHC
ncbi:QRFP-like peptide receptor [Acropora muricata]|uniref:neuropeptide Y receptor type 6-like n=1 Tax=Acropora millepora TaxID=45264 RepID=UPI001CF598A1|nr:neuropeptide Y receptor type 6-like [Acropora millepora]XP_044163073.1 neuropeptide Y receptor type 6-like [Acropora millepora]